MFARTEVLCGTRDTETGVLVSGGPVSVEAELWLCGPLASVSPAALTVEADTGSKGGYRRDLPQEGEGAYEGTGYGSCAVCG